MARGAIVLGMHRSGTSLTASLIGAWGAYGGDHHLIPGDAWNPAGYWEYFPLVRLNMDLLNATGARTMIPPDDAGCELLTALARSGPFRERGLSLLADMQRQQRPWFWKDPRMSILLPFWQEILEDVLYVIVARHPAEVAESLLKRTPDLARAAALLVWQRYMSQALRSTATTPWKLVVSYNGLLSRSAETCSTLCSFLDDTLLAQPDGGTYERTRRMVAVINPALYRNCDPEQVDGITPQQHSLYVLLEELARRPGTTPDPSWLHTESGWREYLCRAARHCIDFTEQAVAD